jgi:predicted ester cyclase
MANQDITSVKQLLERNLKALNSKDIEELLANQQADAELVIPGGVAIRGREQIGQYTQALWNAFPDGVFSFAGQVLTDDAAATELVFTGTHTGPLVTPNGEIPPTGRRVTIQSVSVLRFKDGLIASEHAYVDQLGFMTQLGLMPAAPDTAISSDDE